MDNNREKRRIQEIMNEEINNINTDLKELFVEEKLDNMNNILIEQPDEVVKEITIYNWNIIKKYYDTENHKLLIQYIKFVAYTCFMVEYSYGHQLISEEEYEAMISVYNNIYELLRK